MKSKSEKDYIEQIAPYAQEAQRKYGYLASVLIAQACQENGYGLDNDCLVLMEANNILGMKRNLLNDTWMSKWWDGSYIVKQTPEWYGGKLTYINDAFRKYKDIRSCIMDYCQFMRDAKRDDGTYKYRDVLGITDPGELIKQVRERGYCTDPTYDYSIVKIIAKHNLTQYDIKETKPMSVKKPNIINRVKENAWQVPYHNENSAEYLAIHYLGVNGENPDLYDNGYGGHFYVSKTGQCYQAALVSDEIWHVGRGGYEYIHPKARNYNTIGIECATFTASGRNKDEETWYFTEATQEACARLAAWILYHYKIPFDHLLRHGDITTKNCPSPYKRDAGKGSNWTWEQFKAKVKSYLDGAESEDTYMVEFEKVHMGSTGADVKTLQTMLYAMGFVGADEQPIGVDGSFGKNTEFAVKEFQKINNLEVDGWCGPLTWARLFGKG